MPGLAQSCFASLARLEEEEKEMQEATATRVKAKQPLCSKGAPVEEITTNQGLKWYVVRMNDREYTRQIDGKYFVRVRSPNSVDNETYRKLTNDKTCRLIDEQIKAFKKEKSPH
ncbi:hypothetical protein ACLMYS_003914 [Salmonella enterica]|nr:hypothetical protein [Salmonella enterica subsp. enterica serovar Typhimurium]